MAIIRGQHLIGKKLGSCVLEKLLGYGGSSAVFLAQEQEPERKVAMKVFLPRPGMDTRMRKDFYRRFLREAESASNLDHPNILPIYSYGEEDGLPYIIMPYMPGGTLGEYVAKRGPVPLSEACWYLEQLASALDYAHQQGCVHCDVKPANILLDSEGHVVLSDFGIARLNRPNEQAAGSEPKMSELVMGTPDYLSPEQALGRPLDGRSDVYSLGVTLFFLLTNQLPFKADSAITLALLHVHENPPSLTPLRDDVTPEVDRVLRRALAKEPDERFQSAGEFCVAFAEALTSVGKKRAKFLGKRVEAQQEGEVQARSTPPSVVVHARPVTRRSLLQTRSKYFWLALVACLVLVSATVLTVVYAGNGFYGGGKPPLQATVNPVTIDQLTNVDNWPVSSTFFFSGHPASYHIINKSASVGALAPYYDHVFRNFRLTVTMEEIQNSHQTSGYYGVVFRASADQAQYYLFGISPEDNAHYAFWRYDGQWNPLADGPASSLLVGIGKQNTITIEGRGNTFRFLINGKAVDQAITDATKPLLTSGLVGLYVEDQGTEVAFSHLYIDTLK